MQKKNFISEIFLYTSIESILYQAILCSHQILLFRTISSDLYGKIGTLFSALFLLVPYLNLGLDGSLAPIFKAATASKKAFKSLVIKQLLTVAIVPPALAALYYLTRINIFSLTLMKAFSIKMLIVTGLLIIIESLKKNIKTLLNLALYQKRVAFIEIATLICYVCYIWSRLAYAYYDNGSADTLDAVDFLAPLACTSFCALFVYARSLYKLYNELPDHDLPEVRRSIGMLRIKNWLYQMLHGLYSSNFIIISCAHLYGFELAALLKTVSFCMYGINYIVQHIFGTTISIAVAHIKGSSVQERDELVKIVQGYLHRGACIFFVLLALYFFYASATGQHINHAFLHPVVLFVLLLFCENFVIVREHYYLAQGKIGSIIFGNIIILIPYLLANRFTTAPTSPLFLLYTLLLARTTYIVLLYQAEKIKSRLTTLAQKISVAFSPEIS